MDAIREPVIAVREHLTVHQALAVRGDVETVDVRRGRGVVLVREGAHAGVRDVDVFVVRAELDAVGCDEVVGHGLHDAGVGLEAVDLRTDAGSRAEVPRDVLARRRLETIQTVDKRPTANTRTAHP